MATAKSGKNWEIAPRFIKPNFAAVLGAEALFLCGQKFPYIESYQIGEVHPNSIAHIVDCKPSGPFGEPSLAKDLITQIQVANLYNFYMQSRDKTSQVYGFFVNTLGPHDTISCHQDDTPVESIVLYLTASTLLTINDPDCEKQTFDMNPGDAAFIWNPEDKEQRPFHEATNITRDLRVTAVL